MMTANGFWKSTTLILFVVCLLLYTCNGCLKGRIAKLESEPKGAITKRDTVTVTELVHSTDTFLKKVPAPYAVEVARVDSFIAFELLPVDTAAILKDYLSKVYYRDSSLTKWGKIFILDTLHRNRIAGRSVITDFQIPVTTHYITNTVEAPKKTQLYLGINLLGNRRDLLTAMGTSIMLKTKQDRVYEAGAFIGPDGKLFYSGGIKFKISLK